MTVLFTDIESHTEMMSRLGDAKGRAVLREHDRIMRELFRTHGGSEIKGTGDGFRRVLAQRHALSSARSRSSVRSIGTARNIRTNRSACASG